MEEAETELRIAPILDFIDIPFVAKRMNATLINTEPPSIWRQEPSDDVDRAWSIMEDPRPVAVTREELAAAGHDPDQAVRWPENFGFGSDTYAVRMEVFHQIHCLDSLRR